jgi:hypothetical protein
MVAAYLNILFHYFPGETEKNEGKPHSEEPVNQSRFEPGISLYQIKSTNHYTNTHGHRFEKECVCYKFGRDWLASSEGLDIRVHK